jgi:uncharacterized protein YeeX (DUF496 family)
MILNIKFKVLILFLFIVYVNFAHAQNNELLSKKARYKISSWAHLGPKRRLPETNIEPKKWGFHELDFVQNHDYGKALVDGKFDFRHSIRTWRWGCEPKKVNVVFDLGGKCKLSQIFAYVANNKKLAYLLDNLTIYIRNSKDAKWNKIGKIVNNAKKLPEEKRPKNFIFKKTDINMDARYIKLAFYSTRSYSFTISEIKIYGQRLEPNSFKDKFGLVRTAKRKIKEKWSKIPKFAAGIAKIKNPNITCSLEEKFISGKKIETKTVKQCKELIDNNQNTSVVITKKDKFYIRKQLTIIIDLKQKYNIERVILWSSGHRKKKPKSFINYYSIAIKDCFWLPVYNKINNLFWPGESIKNNDFYPITSPPIGKTTRFLRIDAYENGYNANRMQISEIDIYGSKAK